MIEHTNEYVIEKKLALNEEDRWFSKLEDNEEMLKEGWRRFLSRSIRKGLNVF